MFGAEFELQAGMTLAFEPNCMIGKRFVNLGGTVAVGKERLLEKLSSKFLSMYRPSYPCTLDVEFMRYQTILGF